MEHEEKLTGPEAVSGAPGSAWCVWWLTEADYCGFEPHQERNPLRIPDYAWQMFCDRYGRGGRFRLWVPPHCGVHSLDVGERDPRWKAVEARGDAGGLVIEARHAEDCARWGGLITTLTLEIVGSPNVKDQATANIKL